MSNFISLDFETTGLDPDRHAPLTLGLFNDDHEIYVKMHPGSYGRFEIDAVAMGVNKLDINEVMHWRSATLVDLDLYEMLKPGRDEEGRYEAVGLNVGNFDMQFLRRFLPNTYRLFGHRPVDLNAVFLAQWGLANWRVRRDYFMQRAMEKCNVTEDQMHDAFVDAMIGWHVFKDTVNLEVGDPDDIPY